eukprot:Em0015g135a
MQRLRCVRRTYASAVRFDSPELATGGKSTSEVLRGWTVFKLFTYDPIVDNSLKLFSVAQKLLGERLFESLLRGTVFGQFAGGVDEEDAAKTCAKLSRKGISSVWQYSVEQDVRTDGSPGDIRRQEALYQKQNEHFLKTIELSGRYNTSVARFAAIKFTAISNTSLLQRLSILLKASEATFNSLAAKSACDVHQGVPMDVIAKQAGTSLPPLSDIQLEQFDGFVKRLEAIGECASSAGVRVLIDAEQTWYQPAIHHFTLHYLMPQFNTSTSTPIYNTVQAYLQSAYNTLLLDTATAKLYNIKYALKLVRGAYMVQERAEAAGNGYPSPIHPDKPSTDQSYNKAMEYLLGEVAKGRVNLMVASHNRPSVELAVEKMNELKLSPSDGSVVFGQLLGMADHLTYPLVNGQEKREKASFDIRLQIIQEAKQGGWGPDMQLLHVRCVRRTYASAVRFDSPELVTCGKSTSEVLRGWTVFKLFTYDPIVDNSLKLFSVAQRLLGERLFESLLRGTVFGQFAGGVDEEDAAKTCAKLSRKGISSVWQYSVEQDVRTDGSPGDIRRQEALYQKQNEHFLKTIELSGRYNTSVARFAAIKLTAISNTILLQRLSILLKASEATFNSLAAKSACDVHQGVPMDVIAKQAGTSLPPLSDIQLEQFDGFVKRLEAIGECASSAGVRVLIDAEQTWYQPAIHHFTLHYLMPQFNTSTSTPIYNTVQAYLQSAYNTLLLDTATAKLYNFKYALKLVRGAYMVQERAEAAGNGYPSPIHPDKPSTDQSYNKAMEYLLGEVAKGRVNLMVASHNRPSVELAVEKMNELKLSPSDGSVVFGQSLGMADHLTYPLDGHKRIEESC